MCGAIESRNSWRLSCSGLDAQKIRAEIRLVAPHVLQNALIDAKTEMLSIPNTLIEMPEVSSAVYDKKEFEREQFPATQCAPAFP